MFFKKLLKRPELVPVKVVKAAAARTEQPVGSSEAGLTERRNYPRILPAPDVLEQDWSIWVAEIDKKTNDK
jgi:hypothetical protein